MKKGISLIVLVITIIVMIILAATVIVSLNNTSIIDKANQAVNDTNAQQIQNMAMVAWADAYMAKRTDPSINIEDEVIKALEDKKIDTSKYDIQITDQGVNVNVPANTLGAFVKSAKDYGKTVNYTTTVNGKVISDWKVLYKQEVDGEEYVYLIKSEGLTAGAVPTVVANLSTTKVGTTTIKVGGTNKAFSSVTWVNYTGGACNINTKRWKAEYNNGDYSAIAAPRELLMEEYWSEFANTDLYKDGSGVSYVVGAIGAPTAEMIVASWNEKREATKDYTTYKNSYVLISESGYIPYIVSTNTNVVVNKTQSVDLTFNDSLYVWMEDGAELLATPSNRTGVWYLWDGRLMCSGGSVATIRPVVCIKATIPASKGTTTDIAI